MTIKVVGLNLTGLEQKEHKMNKLKFAQLVAYIMFLKNDCPHETLDGHQIEHIERLTTVAPESVAKCDAQALDQLMALMAEGTRKIEAIKLHRQLTGLGLKESKDVVEKYWLLGRQQPITMDTF